MKKITLLLAVVCCISQFSFSQSSLISEGKTAWASSENGAGEKATNGNDGLDNTRWESRHQSDPEWWAIDLGEEYYVSSVEIDWENANAREFKIQISNDRDFLTGVTDLAHITGAEGGNRKDVIPGSLAVKGRYLRMYGIARNMDYGYSFWEFRAYGMQELAPVNVTFKVPYVQYLEVSLEPADLDGKDKLIIQNKDEVINLRYNQYSSLKMDLLDFRGNYSVEFFSLEEGSTTDSIKGVPLNVQVYPDMEIGVKLIPKVVIPGPPVADAGRNIVISAPASEVKLDGSKSKGMGVDIISYRWEQVSGPATATIVSPDSSVTTVQNLTQLGDYRFRLMVIDERNQSGTIEVAVSVIPPEQIDFTLTSPANKAMITDTRKPVLTWNAYPGATKYEIFINITRDDYEWYASGNLLDRYTKVGESTTNSFTWSNDLVDRWTYKWYVLATTPSGIKYSDKQQFGLYIPVLETVNDGINLVRKDSYDCRDMNKNGTIEPFEDWHLTPEERVADLLNRISPEDKVKQLFYSEDINYIDGFSFSFGPGNALTDMQNAASKTTWGIPTAFMGDKIGGLNTIFPTQLGLAATRDPDLAYRCGNAQRIEHKATGFTGTLAPIAEVSTKVLYPRIHEGGGENADENAAMLRALICGMQGGPEINPQSMLITVKHWPSQGAGGESPTQYDEVTIKYHMKTWLAAVEANAASAMPGYSTSPFLDPSNAGSNNSKPIIDYLRNEIKFNGFIVTDWLAASTEQSVNSIEVGIDVLGGAPSRLSNAADVIASVGIDRINDAARRVLETKIRLGMFENPFGNPSARNPEHHALALEAARKVITLLKNDNDVLPLNLDAADELVVAGPRSRWMNRDNDPNVIWQSIYYNNDQAKSYVQAIKDRATPEGIRVFQQDTYSPDNPAEDVNRGDDVPGATNPKVAVIVIGEKSYTHGTSWDDKNPDIPGYQLDVIRKYKDAGAKVVTVVLLPRPYVLTQVEELSDAILAVYRGGNGIGQAVAECIFGDFAPTGKLPFQLPRSQEQIGTDDEKNQIEKWDLPYDLGATDSERAMIRSYIGQDLPVPPIFGDPLFQYGHGMQGFGIVDDPPSSSSFVKEKDEIQIYPNPFKDEFTAHLKGITGDHLKVLDIAGKVIAVKPVNSDIVHFNFPDCQPGLYLLVLTGNNGTKVTKLIKE